MFLKYGVKLAMAIVQLQKKNLSLIQARNCIFKAFYCQAVPKVSAVHVGTGILEACILNKFGRIFTP